MCVMRTAESVVFTLCPPGPDERKTSMRMSLSSILTSTSSASGSTATVAADVWMRPWVSVAGTRCTRCTPDSQRIDAERRVARDLEYHFFDAAERRVGERHDLDAPAVALAVARVHAVEVGGEERGLVAAGAGADLDDRVAVVERIARQEQRRDPRSRARRSSARGAPVRRAPRRPSRGRQRKRARAPARARPRISATGPPSRPPASAGGVLGRAPRIARGSRSPPGLASARSTSSARASAAANRSRRARGASARGRLRSLLRELLAEALDATSGIEQTLLAGVERVALRADVGVDLGDRGARLERISAGALHGGGGVLGMDIWSSREPHESWGLGGEGRFRLGDASPVF